jgi:photosystem II stability/assembly factor-like uncharacterized protein
MTLMLAGCSGSVSPRTTTKPLNGNVISSIHAIATPHSGPSTPATDVVNLEMFTSRSGVAVVFSPLAPLCKHNCKAGVPARYRDYLAATSDGGQTWRTTGKLPANFNPEATYALKLAFRNPDEGYVQGTDPPETLFTDNAGRTWSLLRTSGWPTALSLSGPSLWIISEFCPASLLPPDGLCPSRLLTYPLGHLTPASETPIPTEGIRASKGISASTRAATLFDRLGPSSAVVEEGSEGSPSSLLLTIDGGRQWTILDDPCEGLVPTGLVAPSRTRWYLYCELDGGMYRGPTVLYATTDQGTNWMLVAEANPEGPNRGNMDPEIAFDLTISGNGRVLWLLGAVDGVASSTHGGRDWTLASISTGGYDTELATAGPTSAWLPLPGYGLYRTTNGTTWIKLT